MRLNNDCIRDILLYIEANTDYEKSCINSDVLVKDLKYDKNTIFYHICMIRQARLVDNVSFADNEPKLISRLSWQGHQYLDNIRDNKVWRLLKEKTSKLSSVSLSLLIQLAPTVLQQYLQI
ncbi:DUF2513 domain-containing protein [Clostridium sulfidigenes]|uniref:DUF2513 domain-containing protein n=1 Tax=Clostridium sulfidigenes TaxID=318464 RepID=UPI003F886FE3